MKIGGEHRIVYGGTAIAAAIGIYADVLVRRTQTNGVMLKLPDLGDISYTIDRTMRTEIYQHYRSRKNMLDFVENVSSIDGTLLPYATIASIVENELRVNLDSIELEITSKIPLKSGCASSSACYAAFTAGLVTSARNANVIQNDKLIDVARDGERISSLNEGAGKIDIATTYHGGYVSVGKDITKYESHGDIGLVLIDTGPKRSTTEMVSTVKGLYEHDKESTEAIFATIDECTRKELLALQNVDPVSLGKCMYENHMLLKKLGVSTPRLDKAVDLAMENGAYGAKLTGGGGGGVVIAITCDSPHLVSAMEDKGFIAFDTSITNNGVSKSLSDVLHG